MDSQALADELNNDPAGLNYAPLIAASNVAGLAKRINDTTRATVARRSISRDDFLRAIVPGMINLLSADSAVQAKYQTFLGLVTAANSITVSDPNIQALVAGMVTDNIMSQAQVDVILQRPGSRAEALWGNDAYVSERQIAVALWGDDR